MQPQLLSSMIGMSGKDRRRAVQLFGQHGARHHVRPGRRAVGEQQVRFLADGHVRVGRLRGGRVVFYFNLPYTQLPPEFL